MGWGENCEFQATFCLVVKKITNRFQGSETRKKIWNYCRRTPPPFWLWSNLLRMLIQATILNFIQMWNGSQKPKGCLKYTPPPQPLFGYVMSPYIKKYYSLNVILYLKLVKKIYVQYLFVVVMQLRNRNIFVYLKY